MSLMRFYLACLLFQEFLCVFLPTRIKAYLGLKRDFIIYLAKRKSFLCLCIFDLKEDFVVYFLRKIYLCIVEGKPFWYFRRKICFRTLIENLIVYFWRETLLCIFEGKSARVFLKENLSLYF